ncbi:MAG: TRCF domain-containing protein, partial [Chlamydiia bacterium]
VKAKETLRSLRVGVDTLTLSATPIPRTLHFAMMGARDLSIIATPPQDRLPIKTILCEEDEHVVQSALLREFSRQGQVYYIHNRVETIYGVAGRLQKLVPQARIAIAHGQMDPDALDEVFHRFKSGEANLLLATSIVENGLDIPNANTLIVERADLFGLAELYQLRGRVGRWNRTAYAYLLVPRHRRLAETTQQRLEALLVNRGHGGGFRVAMRDLEIRGAGDLLGTEQSGHICTVGYHLYTKLLKKTMSALQGAAIAPTSECKVELPVDARLPVEYVPESGLRMEFYQRLGEASSEEEIQQLQHELRDRFGPLPTQAAWLVAIASIRLAASKRGIVALTWERGSLQLQVPSGAPPGITHSSRRCGLYQQDPERSLREIQQQLIAWATETPAKAGQRALELAKKALGK